VLNEGNIVFMNDLGKKFMTFLCGTHGEFSNMSEDLESSIINPLNQRVFYLFEASVKD
jgi:hypothetical protein